MRAEGQKTSEGAASAFCTWYNLRKHECSQAKTKQIRKLDERLGAICGLEQAVFDLTQRQGIADIHHHREAYDLGRGFEISEGIVLHLRRLRERVLRLEQVFSD